MRAKCRLVKPPVDVAFTSAPAAITASTLSRSPPSTACSKAAFGSVGSGGLGRSAGFVAVVCLAGSFADSPGAGRVGRPGLVCLAVSFADSTGAGRVWPLGLVCLAGSDAFARSFSACVADCCLCMGSCFLHPIPASINPSTTQSSPMYFIIICLLMSLRVPNPGLPSIPSGEARTCHRVASSTSVRSTPNSTKIETPCQQKGGGKTVLTAVKYE